MTMPDPGGTRQDVPHGLYDHLVNVSLKARLDGVGDQRLAEVVVVDVTFGGSTAITIEPTPAIPAQNGHDSELESPAR